MPEETKWFYLEFSLRIHVYPNDILMKIGNIGELKCVV